MPRLLTVLAIATVTVFLVVAVGAELGAPAVAMRSFAGTRADVRIDEVIPISDELQLAGDVDVAAARVEGAFATPFAKRPQVAIFGSADHFSTGTRSLFGYSAESASSIAATYGGLFDRRSSGIALEDEADDSDNDTDAVIEHELVHDMVRQLTRGASLPAWFEEGIATLVSQDDHGATEWRDEEALEGRAIAASGRVSFADLATLEEWSTTYPLIGEPLYDYAAVAVREMEARLGWTGLLRLLDTTGRGTPLADAYARAAGESFATLERRLDTSAEAAILVRNSATRDDDVLWILFTGIPNAPADVRISGGRSYSVTFTVTTDALGMYRGTFGSTAERGRYVISAAGVTAVLDTDH